MARTSRAHDHNRTPTHQSWRAMRDRCRRPGNASYRHYGARGIRVCDRWGASFLSFLSDMGERPPGTTLDRIDPDGDYGPGNCRWSTAVEQGRNRRGVKLSPAAADIIRGRVSGGETQQSVADDFGVSQSAVSRVLNRKRW